MTDRTQPDSASTTSSTHIIRYALELGLLWIDGDGRNKVREALDALDALEAQLEAIGAGGVSGPLIGRAAPPTAQAEGWISVAERLPAAYVTVLLTIDGKHITTGEYMHNLSCFSWDQHDDETDDSQATHWMPLPPPPTSAEGVEHG